MVPFAGVLADSDVDEVNSGQCRSRLQRLSPLPLPDLSLTPHSSPVGARLHLFLPRWMDLFPHEPWVLAVVEEGVRLSFVSHPPLSPFPTWISVPRDPARALALRAEVNALWRKGATEVVSAVEVPGFYSHLFVVPKPGGSWRPVIDLSTLNRYLRPPKFHMETARALRRSINRNDLAVSLDLSDAYLHVPMHRSTSRFLRFAIDGIMYSFKALPFGLSLAPWVFTRLVDAVVAVVRRSTTSQISNYLDDFLQKNKLATALQHDLLILLGLLHSLGLQVNHLKSDLNPSADFVHLGMHFLTHLDLVMPSDKRVDNLVELASEFLQLTHASPRQLHRLIGKRVSVAELVHHGFLNLRPLQWATRDWWTDDKNSGTSFFPSLRRFTQPFGPGQIVSGCYVESRSVSQQQLSPSARTRRDRVGALTCSRLSRCAPDCGILTRRGYTATNRSFWRCYGQ